MASATDLEKQKQIPQKDEFSAPVWGISDIAAAASLRKHNKRADLPLVQTKKEECAPFSGGGVSVMAADTVLKNQKRIT